MLNFFRKKYISIHEAEQSFNLSFNDSTKDLRKKVEIVAIDDQAFHPANNLKNSDFKITHISDIQRIDEIEKYHIILCDVNGVGMQLNEKSQGAFVIKEIRQSYPEKFVIAYTAESRNLTIVREAKSYANEYLKKDASIEEWCDLLDKQIKIIINPIELWKKERIRLLEKNIELADLLELEQIILTNIQKPSEIKKTINQHLNKKQPSDTLKTEISRFIASKSFDLALSVLI